ncbi:MAG: rhomboid family intramembrane serine protease [Verrucomicrobiota bacterium JB022]|nr:rhomboid family intramembrane serine protease [Verrucomicrobiota bacterium JB022]
MIPIKDHNPARRRAIIVPSLLVFNAVVFLWELSLGARLHEAVVFFGVVPRFFTDAELREQVGLFHLAQSLITTMFFHGGWFHLLANMWTLYIFGDNVEDRLRPGRFIALYLLAGIAASALQIVAHPNSPIPVIGASGAIAGVMGAYLRLYPLARIDMLIPPFFFGPFFRISAYIFLLYWLGLQFFNGFITDPDAAGGGVAWWAHVGGFGMGYLLCHFLTLGDGRGDTYQSPSGRWRPSRR